MIRRSSRMSWPTCSDEIRSSPKQSRRDDGAGERANKNYARFPCRRERSVCRHVGNGLFFFFGDHASESPLAVLLSAARSVPSEPPPDRMCPLKTAAAELTGLSRGDQTSPRAALARERQCCGSPIAASWLSRPASISLSHCRTSLCRIFCASGRYRRRSDG